MDEVDKTTVTENQNSIDNYSIGDEIDIGGIKFNIYKINDTDNELYLLAQQNIATTQFSDDERSYKQLHNYEGSLVEGYINRFVDTLEDKGIVIKASGIIEKDDLYELGFIHSDNLSGLPYKCGDTTPDFVKSEKSYWLGGYCKYETRSWVYFEEKIDTQSCDDEYGVRPVIIIEPSEIGKTLKETSADLSISEVVASNSAWTSEGGIHNPYDRFYFDCENMVFKNTFESSELSRTNEYKMEFIDEKKIQIDGLMTGYEYPAEITIVDENKLRIQFIDDKYNDGDYFLNRVIE